MIHSQVKAYQDEVDRKSKVDAINFANNVVRDILPKISNSERVQQVYKSNFNLSII